MANPNIVGVTSILGKTEKLSVTTSETNLVTNDTSSGTILKINTIMISNIDGVKEADISVDIYDGTTAYFLVKTIPIPTNSSFVVISKDTSIYLEEGNSIRCLASASGDLQAVCSYEIIS